ncbi:MAG: hypothetical protein ACOYIK_10780 [Coriobacteriales bacterium]
MNPVIIIPSYICGPNRNEDSGVLDTYDHMTPLDRPGELPRCLSSLRDKNIDTPIAILVISEKGIEEDAEAKVRDLAARYPELNISVVGVTDEAALHARMEQVGVGDYVKGISLTGYGSSKNLGLIFAASMGYTEVIFIDDDEIVEDPEFMDKACYGLGMLTQRGVPILTKSGYFRDKRGSYKARKKNKWYNRFWNQHKGFNEWIDSAMQGPRLSSSNTACGGLLAIHREAYRRVSFDPWISRGEDLDFLLNVRMYGSEVWFDNLWEIKHIPPKVSKTESRRFTQDIYRWIYETRKLEFSKTQIDLLQVQSQSLEPYPGPFLESNIGFHVFMTALLRTVGRKGQRKGYFHAAMVARKQAVEYAKENCSKYFAFQRQWPEVVAILEEDIALQGIFENSAVVPMTKEEIERSEAEVDDSYGSVRDAVDAFSEPVEPVESDDPVEPESDGVDEA